MTIDSSVCIACGEPLKTIEQNTLTGKRTVSIKHRDATADMACPISQIVEKEDKQK